jgi:hypothetical protein
MLTEYIQGIYNSDITTSFDRQIYKKYNINIVINLTQLHGFVDLSIKKIRIPLSNDLNFHTDIELINKNLLQILEFINSNYVNNNILIVCESGTTISPIIIALFIYKYGNINISDVKKILKTKNDAICIDHDLSIFKI